MAVGLTLVSHSLVSRNSDKASGLW